MHVEQALVLGHSFFDWSELTNEYIAGMDALRRREPGASARMMEIARRMSHYQRMEGPQGAATTGQRAPPPIVSPKAGWMKLVAAMLFSPADNIPLLH